MLRLRARFQFVLKVRQFNLLKAKLPNHIVKCRYFCSHQLKIKCPMKLSWLDYYFLIYLSVTEWVIFCGRFSKRGQILWCAAARLYSIVVSYFCSAVLDRDSEREFCGEFCSISFWGLILVTTKADKQIENRNQRWLLVFSTNKDPNTQKVKKNAGFNRATHNMRTFSG